MGLVLYFDFDAVRRGLTALRANGQAPRDRFSGASTTSSAGANKGIRDSKLRKRLQEISTRLSRVRARYYQKTKPETDVQRWSRGRAPRRSVLTEQQEAENLFNRFTPALPPATAQLHLTGLRQHVMTESLTKIDCCSHYDSTFLSADRSAPKSKGESICGKE